MKSTDMSQDHHKLNQLIIYRKIVIQLKDQLQKANLGLIQIDLMRTIMRSKLYLLQFYRKKLCHVFQDEDEQKLLYYRKTFGTDE